MSVRISAISSITSRKRLSLIFSNCADAFSKALLHCSNDLNERSPGLISKAGWTIRYIFGKESGREYLEFYAMHRMTDDRHCKIYEDGECVELDAICSMYGFDPKIPGDQERAELENRERNRRVYKELQAKGLEMMSVNTYLSINKVPLPDKK